MNTTSLLISVIVGSIIGVIHGHWLARKTNLYTEEEVLEGISDAYFDGFKTCASLDPIDFNPKDYLPKQ